MAQIDDTINKLRHLRLNHMADHLSDALDKEKANFCD